MVAVDHSIKKQSSCNVSSITLRCLDMPLKVPYGLSYRTFHTFKPIVVEVAGSDGRVAWGDGHISPGSSAETHECGWTFCQRMASNIVGKTPNDAIDCIAGESRQSKVAASALITAMEMLSESPILDISQDRSFPLVTPVNGLEADDIEAEIDEKLRQGFSTFKVKVGKDVNADLRRISWIQKQVGTRAALRVDANRGYDREQGIHFASSLDPTSIELFEQPCAAEDWVANAAVARASTVPLMLDEPICSIEDIERAATIEGVGYCKLKLKRFGSIAGLHKALTRVSELGMEPVLGDGLGSELTAWMEACVAQTTVHNAGEFNGFLKPRERLFSNPLRFEDGELILPQGYKPQINSQLLQHLTQEDVVITTS